MDWIQTLEEEATRQTRSTSIWWPGIHGLTISSGSGRRSDTLFGRARGACRISRGVWAPHGQRRHSRIAASMIVYDCKASLLFRPLLPPPLFSCSCAHCHRAQDCSVGFVTSRCSETSALITGRMTAKRRLAIPLPLADGGGGGLKCYLHQSVYCFTKRIR